MDKDMKRIIRALEDQGFDVKRTKSGHHRVTLNGRYVTTLAGTPSDRRGLLNALAAAKRAGFRKPP